MLTQALEKNFLTTYSDRQYRHTTSVRHNGTLIAFAMGRDRAIYYTVLELDGQQDQTIDAKNWSASPRRLMFPREIVQVGFGIVDPKPLPLVTTGGEAVTRLDEVRPEEIDPFLSSTARLSADAPFQVFSDQQYIYVFRQAIGADDPNAVRVSVADETGEEVEVPIVNETLLVDRFIFVENQLQMTRDVRFRRSRNKFRPLNANDSLGAKDMDEIPFFEPTQELDFIRNLQGGRFSVLQLPTQIADIKRWQIFAYNSSSDRVDSFNIERSPEGWFNTQGTTLNTDDNAVVAESALQLDGVDDYISLGEFSPGDNFTVEMWVNPTPKSGEIPDPIPDQILLSKTTPTGEPIFSVGYYADFLGINFKGIQLPNAETQQETFSQTITAWHHVAITVATLGNTVTLTAYHNGAKAWTHELNDTTLGDISGHGWEIGRLFDGKDGRDYFEGSLDEIRIWNRTLSAVEIIGDRETTGNSKHRLIGNELGLFAYYRFDEGIGNQLYDQTDQAIHGTIQGMTPDTETWIASAAPLQASPGISRSSFGFKHRTIASGLSALLYFQQEDMVTGNDPTPKPIKQNARVMLAVATRREDEDHNRIAVLDFAVTKSGKLAQILDNIPLETLKSQIPASVREMLPAEDEETTLIEVATEIEKETIPRLDAELTELIAENELVNAQIRANEDETDQRERRKAEVERELASNTAGVTFYSQQSFRGDRFKIEQGYDGDLNGFPLNSMQLDPGVKVTLYAPGGVVHPYTQSRQRLGGTYTPVPPYNRVVVDLSVLVNERNQINARLAALADALVALQTKSQNLQKQLMAKRRELQLKRDQLTGIRKLVLEDLSLPMPLVHLDPMGMTVFGGVLDFAQTEGDPQLFESGTGQLALYFQGMNDEFLAAYYNPKTSRGELALDDVMLYARVPGEDFGQTQVIIEEGTQAETCTVKLQSVLPDHVLSRLSELEQQKADLIAERDQLAVGVTSRTASLYSRRFFQGEATVFQTGDQGAMPPELIGNLRSLQLEQGVQIILYEGDNFTGTAIPYRQSQQRLGGTYGLVPTYRSFKVELTAEAMSEDALAIEQQLALVNAEIARLSITISETWTDVSRDPEQFVAILNGQDPDYDYSQVEHNRRAYNVKHGSFLIKGIARAGADVQNTTPENENLSGIGSIPSWIANPPGNTVKFVNENGQASELYLKNLANEGENFSHTGDLTLEAWVKAEGLDATAHLIDQSSSNSRYGMGLTRSPSALNFDGVDDYIEVKGGITGITNQITVELWFYKPDQWDDQYQKLFGLGTSQSNFGLIISQGRGDLGLYFGLTNEAGNYVFIDTPRPALNQWHHLAALYDGAMLKLYLNGELVGEKAQFGSIRTLEDLYIGWLYNEEFFRGYLDDIRIWNYPRSEADLQAFAKRRLKGNESGLVGYYRFANQTALDYSPNANHGTIVGNPTPVEAPIPNYHLFAGVANKWVQTEQVFLTHQWEHFAAVYNQSYALQFDGRDDYVDAGNSTGLNLSQDLTLEVQVTLNAPRTDQGILNAPRTDQGILSKGVINGGNPQQTVPYALYITKDGRVVFASEDQNHRLLTLSSPTNTVRLGRNYHIAVTRKKHTEGATAGNADLTPLGLAAPLDGISLENGADLHNEENKETIERAICADYVQSKQRQQNLRQQQMENNRLPATEISEIVGNSIQEYLELQLYINGALVAEAIFPATELGMNDQPLEIGKAYGIATGGDHPTIFGNIPLHLRGALSEVRLWNVALNGNELNRDLNGTERGLVAWWQFEEGEGSDLNDTLGSNLAAIKGATWIVDPNPDNSTLMIYHNGEVTPTEPFTPPAPQETNEPYFRIGQGFAGNLDEVRLWKAARKEEAILDNLFGRLKGEKRDLLGYYTFDQDNANAETSVYDHSLEVNRLEPNTTAINELTRIDYIFSTAPICDDIALVRNALEGVTTVFQDEIHARPAVEEYGDLQYTPTGELVGAMKRCYSFIKQGEWHLYTGFKVGNIITEWIGQVQFDPQVMGFIEGAPPIPSENLTEEAGDDFNDATALEIIEAENVTYTVSSEKEQGYNTALSFAASIGVEGDIDSLLAPLGFGISFPIEFNLNASTGGNFEASQGWSSAESQGRGINTTRNTNVALRGEWEDPDFPEIPEALASLGRRYLPANVGFAVVQSETADVFALRMAHNGALVSLRFRPNRDIPRDINLIPFPINPQYTKQGTLDGTVGYSSQGRIVDPDYLNTDAADQPSYFKPQEAYALRNRIQQEEQQLKAYYENFQTSPMNRVLGASVAATQGAIAQNLGNSTATAITNLMPPMNGRDPVAEGFAKRNLVNTYIWTAEGGFFAQSTQTSTVRQEVTGSSYGFSGSADVGFGLELSGLGLSAGIEFNASIGGQLNVTKTATKDSESSYELSISVDTPGHPQKPGTVDAYRFFTFYLEPAVENFDQFFSEVIDPIWLAESNHPNAVALRQANNTEKKPPCWRVFHRVTFVSRVLPEFPDDTMPPLDRALMAANVSSNWQLIQRLDPLVRSQKHDFALLAEAIRKAIRRYLPELQPHQAEIIEYMAVYYGLL